MTPYQRESFLKLSDGVPEVLPLLYHIDRLRRKDEVLKWLISNQITGKKLLEFFQNCGSSSLQLCSIVLSKVKKQSVEKVYAGKDYLV